MPAIEKIKEEIKKAFTKRQADVLLNVVDIVDETVKAKDFNELKSIVAEIAKAQKELAEAQKRTEDKLEELVEAQKRTEQRVEELAEAQERTEQRVEELAEAQKETQKEVSRLDRALSELAEAQKRTEEEVRKLAIELNRTRQDLGGLSRSFSYAFENEAYRMLPNVLKERYAITIKDKVVRAEIGGKEVNFFAKAEKEGKEVYIVGEAKLRLDDTMKREDVIGELEEKVLAVKAEYGEVEIVKLIVTHFATKGILKKAEQEGIIVVQSYEW